MSHTSPPRAHALVFNDPEQAVEAVRQLRAHGFAVEDVFAPFPVHGMPEAMGLKPSHLPWATLIGGITGLTTALSLQFYTHTWSWPLNVGGKTYTAFPSMIPVSFELTVLFAGLATAATLLALCGLYPTPAGVTPPEMPLPESTDDRVVVVVGEGSEGFSLDGFRELAGQLDAEKVLEDWRVAA